jgi:hypothetical protein
MRGRKEMPDAPLRPGPITFGASLWCNRRKGASDMAMNTKGGKKPRGRTSISGVVVPNPQKLRPTQNEKKQSVKRSVDPGPGHRGDRRDTHPAFSTGKKRGPGGKTKPSLNRGTRKN